MMEALERKGEYLTRVIMADFGISEEEMALGPGEQPEMTHLLPWHSNLLAANGSGPEAAPNRREASCATRTRAEALKRSRLEFHELNSRPLSSKVIALPAHHTSQNGIEGDEAKDPSPKERSPVQSLQELLASPRQSPTSAAWNQAAAQAAAPEIPHSPQSNTSVTATAGRPSAQAATRTNRQTSKQPARSSKDRSSQYRGVTKHRRSGRWEAHLWVKELGRQVYLGGYECEEHAAEAYDVAALKCKGCRVRTNFPVSRYSDLTECMGSISVEELIMAVRRQSQGFSRGTSSFRGVTHHPSGRWEARIGVPGSKHIYLGLFASEREAAKAYDRSLVRLRGSAAATNFSLSDYRTDLADYHKMQQRVLQSEGSSAANLWESTSDFESWIKHGPGGDASDAAATGNNPITPN